MAFALCISLNAISLVEAAEAHFGVGDAFANDPSAQVGKRLDLYKQAGIGILRVDIDWRTQETQEGVWQQTPNLALLQLGQRAGLLLKANIGSIHSPPVWFLERHPEAQLKNLAGLPSYNDISYWYRDLHALLEDKDDRLFASLSKSGVLNSVAYLVIPMGPAGEALYPSASSTTSPNSTMQFWFCDESARADFRNRMREKFGSLNSANKAWGTDFTNWSQVDVSRLVSKSGPLWREVLEWYRDAKRDFAAWQVQHYQRLRDKYFRSSVKPKLLILIPGSHITPFAWRKAIDTGGGGDELKMMCDSEFLLDLAHRVGADVQYTGLPNMAEIEYLRTYMRNHSYKEALWGENAGNLGDPTDLDAEVLANGLRGQEYIGSNLFQSDHVTPTEKYWSLKRAHAWLTDVWAGKQASPLSFEFLPVAQGTCIYADKDAKISLCMQADANLVLRDGKEMRWESRTAHHAGFCADDEDPSRSCFAVFQGDGNLVIYRGAQPLWASETGTRGKRLEFASHPPYLRILARDDQAIWTAAH